MLEATLKIINPLGLHARAAAQLVHLSVRFQSRITIERADNGMSADAKSILSVLSLAAPAGTEIHLRADGQDEEKAFEAISELFQKGFGDLIQ